MDIGGVVDIRFVKYDAKFLKAIADCYYCSANAGRIQIQLYQDVD
jgi:hypothetical protein